MNEEVRRIMKLVEQGKLSAEDAMELIDAFNEPKSETGPESTSPPPPPGPGEPQSPPSPGAAGPSGPPPPRDRSEDPLSQLVDAIERIGRGVASSVNWKEVADQAKQGASKGVEALKKASEDIRKGKINFKLFGSHVERELRLGFEVPEGKLLRIENPTGDVRLIGGQSESVVIAQARVHGSDREDAQAKADLYTLVIEESDQWVLIKQPDMSGLAVDLEVRLVGSVPIECRSEHGDVHADQLSSGFKLVSKAGDVKLDNVHGVVEIHNAAGDLTMHGCNVQSLAVEQKRGDLTLHEVRGNLNLRCASGDVELEECSGKSISIEAVSGDISLDLVDPVDGHINVRAVHGDVIVRVADGGNARVILSTLRGEASTNLDLQDEAITDQRITGRQGEGLGTIDISAVNGDVRLDLREYL